MIEGAKLAVTLVVAAFVFHHAEAGIVNEPACRPNVEAAAGWAEPFAISIHDGEAWRVVDWKPNETTATRFAIRVAYSNPSSPVRVASVHELTFRTSDGTPCTYSPDVPTPTREASR